MGNSSKAGRKHLPPERIAELVREIERRSGTGEAIAQACAAIGVAEPNFYRWRAASRRRAGVNNAREELKPARAAILEAAKSVFLRLGYSTSLDDVAAEAGVARQTLYNQFGSKQRLFTEVVKMIYERMVRTAVPAEQEADLMAALTGYGRRYLLMATDPESVALQRITIAEHLRYPELGGISFALRASHDLPSLAEEIVARLRFEMERGTIEQIDPHIVSVSFCGCMFGLPRQRALAGLTSRPEETEALLRATVEIFLRGLSYKPLELQSSEQIISRTLARRIGRE